jgi:hypothetical protein
VLSLVIVLIEVMVLLMSSGCGMNWILSPIPARVSSFR